MGMTAAVLALVLGFPWEPTRLPEPNTKITSGLKQIRLGLHGEQERYDQIPFEGNLDTILKQLLRRANEDEELSALLEKLRQNPKLKSIDPALLQKLEGQAWSPRLRDQLMELARFQKDGGISYETFQQLLRKLLNAERIAKDLERFTLPEFRVVPATELDAEQRLERWTRDFLEELDDTGAGEFLKDSPAWQNALKNLEQYVKNADGRLDWLGRVTEGWRVPEAWRPRLGEWTGRLPSVNLPNLPRWRISPPNLSRLNLGFGGGAVRMSTPPAVEVSENLLWVLVLLLLALLGWVFYQKLGRGPAALGSARRRGPWPIDPALVTTRTQLIQVFDYLALLLLGDEVRSWNHVAVARKLGEEGTRSSAARALGQLYELARYTPGDDLLTPDAQAAARRHLVHLAGRAAA